MESGLLVLDICQLRNVTLDDEALMNDFCRAPAAMNFHHAFVGGLLEHTLNAMEVGDAVCKFYPKLNRDIVVAGIFLHDLQSVYEQLASGHALEETAEGAAFSTISRLLAWAPSEKIVHLLPFDQQNPVSVFK